MYISAYAKHIGLDQDQSSFIISLLLGMSIPGIILSGFVANFVD